jgi:hypothetical protein
MTAADIGESMTPSLKRDFSTLYRRTADPGNWIAMTSLNQLLNLHTRSLVSLLKHDLLKQKYPSSRRFSAAAHANDQLPLAGIKVLDMTRVLAGVSRPPAPPTTASP